MLPTMPRSRGVGARLPSRCAARAYSASTLSSTTHRPLFVSATPLISLLLLPIWRPAEQRQALRARLRTPTSVAGARPDD
jgi:hypothetical protein